MTIPKGALVAVTGASRGIGAATARLFVQRGARVALLARPGAALDQLVAELGAQAVALPCDTADFAAVSAALGQAQSNFGPLEVLINNAGTIDPIARLSDANPDEFHRAISVNLGGVFNGMRAALPGMMARGRGTILTVGSGAAHNPIEGWSAYCSSKAGAYMLTRMADLEARASGVRVISLSPGTVATDMQREIKASGVNAVSQLDWAAHIPPEWPAQALWWMCGPQADAYLGAEISLRDPAIRAAVGLAA